MKWAAASVAVTAVLAACVPLDMPEPDEGQAVYMANCAICHGASGRGDGSLAPDISPRPADLTSIASRNNGVFPRAKVLSTIDGYTKSGPVGQNMPEFGLMLHGDIVPVDTGDGILTPTPRPLAALLAYLEDIQK